MTISHAFKCLPTSEAGVASELPFDTQELVELGHPFTAAAGTRLDVPRARRHGQVGDCHLLRFARPM